MVFLMGNPGKKVSKILDLSVNMEVQTLKMHLYISKYYYDNIFIMLLKVPYF